MSTVKLIGKLHVGSIKFTATLFGERLFAKLRFFGDCFLFVCSLLCLPGFVSFSVGFVACILSYQRLSFSFAGLPSSGDDPGNQDRERGGSQTQRDSKPCTLDFRLSQFGFDRFEVARNLLGQSIRILRAIGGFQFQALLCERYKFLVGSAFIQSSKAVAKLSTAGHPINLCSIVGDIRWLAGQDFSQDRSKPEHVRPFIHLIDFTERLFGWHVSRRAHHTAHLRLRTRRANRWHITADTSAANTPTTDTTAQRLNDALVLLQRPRLLFVRNATNLQYFGQSPVHDLHFAKCPDHDVGGFQVAMDHAATVRVRHRLTNLLKDTDQLATFVRRVFAIGQQLRQRLTLHQLHGKERSLVRELPEFINRSDAGML